MLGFKELELIEQVVNSDQSDEMIKEILERLVKKNPENIVKLGDYIKLLHDLKVSLLVSENRFQYSAIEFLSHFFNRGGCDKQITLISISNALMILFPDPLRWNQTTHSPATKKFFSQFMEIYPAFRYSSDDSWFEKFSNPKWWEKIEEVYLRDFKKES